MSAGFSDEGTSVVISREIFGDAKLGATVTSQFNSGSTVLCAVNGKQSENPTGIER
jgi:hypothetical protein